MDVVRAAEQLASSRPGSQNSNTVAVAPGSPSERKSSVEKTTTVVLGKHTQSLAPQTSTVSDF